LIPEHAFAKTLILPGSFSKKNVFGALILLADKVQRSFEQDFFNSSSPFFRRDSFAER